MRYLDTSRRTGPRAALAVLLVLAAGGCAAPATTTQGGGPAARQEAASPKYLRLARNSADSGNHRAALEFYRKAAQANPDAFAPRLGIARSAYELGRPGEAAAAYQAALEVRPDAATAKLGLGKALLADEELRAAIDTFDEMIGARRADHRPYLAKGVALDLLGRHAEAQATYRQGLEQAPDNLALKNNLGLSLAVAGEHKRAIRLLERIARDPMAPARTRQNLALAYALAGDMQGAAVAARRDLAPEVVERNLSYYRALHDLQIRRAARAASPAAAPDDAAAVHGTPPARTARAKKPPETSRPDEGARPAADDEPIVLTAAVAMPGHAAQPLELRVEGDGAPVAAARKVAATPGGERESADVDEAPDLASLAATLRNALAPDEPDERDAAADGAPRYWAQLASLASAAGGERERRRLQTRYPVLGEALPLSVQRAEVADEGVRYRLRSGPFVGKTAPRRLCAALHAREMACLVVRD